MKKMFVCFVLFVLVIVAGCGSTVEPLAKTVVKIEKVPVISEADFSRYKSMLENSKDSCKACDTRREFFAELTKRDHYALEKARGEAEEIKSQQKLKVREYFEKKDNESFKLQREMTMAAYEQFEREDAKTFARYAKLHMLEHVTSDFGDLTFFNMKQENIPALRRFLAAENRADEIRKVAREVIEKEEKEANEKIEAECNQKILRAQDIYDRAVKPVKEKLGLED